MPSSSIDSLNPDNTENPGRAAALLAGVLESAMDAIITVDAQHRILMYNRAAEKIFGWSRQEMLLQSVERLMPLRLRAGHDCQLDDGNTGRMPQAMGVRQLIRGLRRNGEEFPLAASISVLDTPEGQLSTLVLRDISEMQGFQRGQAEHDARFRESQRRLQVAQRMARIGYWQIDLETSLMWWCDEACRVLGVDRALLDDSHEGFLRLIHPGDRRAFETQRDAAVQAGLPLDLEFRVLTACGKVRWVHMTSWVDDEDGGENTRCRTGAIRELTSRRQLERVMDCSAELLNRMGALAGVGGWEVRMESMTPHCSDEVFRILELDSSMMGALQNPLGFFAPEAQPVILAAVRDAMAHAIPWDLELALITAKGQRIWVRSQGRAMLEDGKVAALFGVLQDITGTRATEAALRLSNQELEAFSYAVSHDLRSPLNSINGFSHLLAKKLDSHLAGEVRHYLSRIQAGTAQMGKQIEGLLSMAQVSRTRLNNEPVDLSVMTRSILGEWRSRKPERQVTVHVESGMQAHGDGRLIRVMLENLLANAWKFTSKNDHSEIEVGQEIDAAGMPVYFVSDNGAGFDMAYADKLFNPFQRLHGVSEFPGMGMGLATVSRVIGRHAGRMWAESAPGRGARFFFTLPRSPVMATCH